MSGDSNRHVSEQSDSTSDLPVEATRRSVLQAVGAGALALGLPTVAAHDNRTETCGSGPYDVGDGQFSLVNNDWGYPDNEQCIFEYDDGAYGWNWNRGSTGDGDPNYPEVLHGTKPWGSDSGAAAFPVQFGDVWEMDLSLDVDNGASGGNWDLALEWWLTENQPGGGSDVGESVTHEIMVVLEWGNEHGHGTPNEEYAVQDAYGNDIDYWVDYDIGWSFHIFRVRANQTPGNLDLSGVVDYLRNQVSDPYGRPLSDDLWVSGIEIGNEYWDDTSGETTVNTFDATINGSSASSGHSSGGGGGGGGSGGGGDSGGDDGSSSGPIATGTYRVTNVNSGQFLEVGSADTSDGANVNQWSDTGHPCQEWYVEDTGGGEYTFENVNSGKLMEVANADTSDGANVQQRAATGSANQRWSVEDTGGGEYRVVNVNSGLVADVEGASTNDGANVLQWSDNGGANQRWYFDQI